MKPERIRWKRTHGRQQLLLEKVCDAVTEEFDRDAMVSKNLFGTQWCRLPLYSRICASSPMSQSRRLLRLLAMPMTKLATCFRGAVPILLY